MQTLRWTNRWIIREWKWSPLLTALTFFLLFLAYFCLLTNVVYQNSKDRFIREQSTNSLGADFVIQTVIPFTDEDLTRFKNLGRDSKVALKLDYLATIRSEKSATMAEVIGVSDNYPLAGAIKTTAPSGQLDWSTPASLYADEDLAKLLSLQVGDGVRLGEKNFMLRGVIAENSILARGSAFAARVYVQREEALSTGLVRFGSLVNYEALFSTASPNKISLENALTDLQKEKAWRLRSASQSLGQIQRTLDFVGLYLSWLTLLIILLGFITGFYLSQVQLKEAAPRIAMLLQLGLSLRRTQLLYGAKIFFEQFLAFTLALGTFALGLKFLNPQLTSLPIPFQLKLDGESFVWGIALALVASVLFTLPFISRLGRIQPRSLLDQSGAFLPETSPLGDLVPYVTIMLFFYGLIGYFFGDWRVSSAWLGYLLLSLLVPMYLLPLFGRALAGWISFLPMKIALLQLQRVRFASTLLYLSIGQCLLMLTLLPQFKGALEQQLNETINGEVPSFFALNMQEEELENIRDFFKSRGAELKYTSPLILARLQKINDQEPEDEQLATRPLRLSYRTDLLQSETPIEGPKALPEGHESDDPALISVEENYARRNGLARGDILNFDIGGLEVNGRIEQIRRVQWESFQPNFFIQFQSGVLNDFPKTWIGVVYGITSDEKLKVLRESVDRFTSLSLIDLSQTLEKVSQITRSLAGPLQLTLFLQNFATFLVLFFLTFYHQKSRTKEMALFQLLGFSASKMTLMLVLENGLIALVAAFFSMAIGLGLSRWVLSTYFEISFTDWRTPLMALGLSVSMILAATAGVMLIVSQQKGQEKTLLAD